MPFTFVVCPSVPLVCVHGVGDIDLMDLHDATNDLTHARVADFPRLVDLRSATLHIPVEYMHQYVAFKAHHRQAHRAPCVAAITGDLLTYGMLRMYQLLSAEQEPNFGVFHMLSEAIAWLGIDQEVEMYREVGAS